MIKSIVVPVDTEEPLRLEEVDVDDLDAYHYLERTEPFALYRPEAGLYVNPAAKHLPPNPRATALLWAHNRVFLGCGVIVGPAFIVGPPDQNGRDTDVPRELAELLLHTPRYRVEVQVTGETRWAGNEQRFSDWFTAYAHGVDLAQRWTAVTDVRIVPADTDTPPPA